MVTDIFKSEFENWNDLILETEMIFRIMVFISQMYNDMFLPTCF